MSNQLVSWFLTVHVRISVCRMQVETKPVDLRSKPTREGHTSKMAAISQILFDQTNRQTNRQTLQARQNAERPTWLLHI